MALQHIDLFSFFMAEILPVQTPVAPAPKKRRSTSQRSKGPRPGRKKGRRGKKKPPLKLWQNFLFIALEALGLATVGVVAIVVLLGTFANRFSGTSLLHNLLPFAGGILLCIFVAAVLLSLWKEARRWLRSRFIWLPPALVVLVAVLIGVFVPREYFTSTFGYYRTLVGGKEEAGRVTLAHQVYAAYRRLETAQLIRMVGRSGPYAEAIDEAAAVYKLDADLLKGLAATESSFLSRTSSDGGHGLFQITQAPAAVVAAVNRIFPEDSRQIAEPRYNAFLGAATLRHYLSEMKDDLFLGLLAYNIGPANGGLRFIMKQYGATDFITAQPYLQQLPRDYPIRVLAYSLAFRVERLEGKLLAYEEGRNALRIQALGIPGIDSL
ncbi:MAG: transglycosylase SLT domain-containing protein [Desulforhopalus sp.]|nr:transglycosylase SLT domain-containing protein [Desulforhopalus sp.]